MKAFYIVWSIVSIASLILSGVMSMAYWITEEERPPKTFIVIIIASFVVALYTSWKACGGV